jgi:hypothetical protein
MEESNELKKLFTFLQGVIYASVILEAGIFCLHKHPAIPQVFLLLLERLSTIRIYENIAFSKVFTLVLIVTVSVGTRPKKNINLKPMKHIALPLSAGFILMIASVYCLQSDSKKILYAGLSRFDTAYLFTSFFGVILIHMAMDNFSKQIKSGLMQDRFNTENESFDQSRKRIQNAYSVNVPIRFYYEKGMRKGWLNIVNPFRGTLLIGTPGSGKTYSIIIPFIKQHIAKGFSVLVYDYKYPDLSKVAYHHYKQNIQKNQHQRFHVINLNRPEKSRRINPLKAAYITSLAVASETAEALIHALKKSDKAHGTDQFFSQSATNFLASVIYYLSRYKGGIYSSLPHVLAFTNHGYEDIFKTLFKETELHSLLSPFKSAFDRKAFDQLEGQIGTLRINLSRLATKETCWIFSGEDFPMGISDPKHPAILVLANAPETQSINSACYSLVLNRLILLLNRKGNLPTSLIVDEVPTVYIHRVENLIATARSNKVSVLMGLQEIPQFRQQYGREAAETICSVTANVLSGSARHQDTLVWLEKLFGKVKQLRSGISIDRTKSSVSINEYMDHLIPASKIANLKAGELVGQVAGEAESYTGKFSSDIYHCKVALDEREIRREEKSYTDLPDYYDFGDSKEQILRNNMEKINREVRSVIDDETGKP